MSVWFLEKLQQFWAEPWMEKMESLSDWYWLCKSQFYYRRFFREIGGKTRIIHPLRLKNTHNISLGRNVIIHKHCWLQTQPKISANPQLVLKDGCVIGNFNHITCAESIVIEEKVLTADKVIITDHGHQFEDPAIPIMAQGIRRGRPVRIGAGTWIGENVAILSCEVGKNCVIGANSVVVSDIPDLSLAVGAPARVIKSYDFKSNSWKRT